MERKLIFMKFIDCFFYFYGNIFNYEPHAKQGMINSFISITRHQFHEPELHAFVQSQGIL